MTDVFHYGQLDASKKEIRVLKLDLGEVQASKQSSRFSSSLRCQMQHVSLLEESIAPFNAVSYCWGMGPNYEDIEVGGKALRVPSTAISALRGIFFDDHEIPSEYISADEDRIYHTRQTLDIPVWIDAICINQDDLVEKSNQISLMGDVYSKAEKVLVWLGDATKITESGIRSVLACYEVCKDSTNNFASAAETSALRRKNDAPNVFDHLRQPIPSSCDKQALMAFYANPWFRRLWVFQEVVLANFAICFQGHFALPWFAAATVASWISKGIFLGDWGGAFSAQAGAGLVHASRALLATANASSTFEVLLMAGASFETSHPHDQVYGLLGLATKAHPEALALQTLQPDYSKSLATVYAEATLAAMQASKSLWLLQYVIWGVPKDSYTYPAITDSFPSWAPRFDLISNAQIGSPSGIPTNFKQDGSDGMELCLQFVPSNVKMLKVRGVVVDVVKTRSEMIAVIEQPRTYTVMRVLGPFFVEMCKSWHLMYDQHPEQPVSEMVKAIDRSRRLPVLRSFALAATSGLTIEQQDANMDKRFFADFAAFIVRYFDAYRIACSARLRRLLEELGSERGNPASFEHAVLQNSFNRPLFTTEDGRHGLGVQGMQAGDVVCILFGSKVPILLRKYGEQWSFVGAVYMDSLMSGEFAKQLRKEDRLEARTRWFEIE